MQLLRLSTGRYYVFQKKEKKGKEKRLLFKTLFYSCVNEMTLSIEFSSYVGNKMVTLVLQALGYEVSAINTVNYSEEKLFFTPIDFQVQKRKRGEGRH